MRELTLQGGEVLKLQEENRSGKSDIEVSVVLHFVLYKEVNDVFLLSLTDHAPLLNSVFFFCFLMVCKLFLNCIRSLHVVLALYFCSNFSLL